MHARLVVTSLLLVAVIFLGIELWREIERMSGNTDAQQTDPAVDLSPVVTIGGNQCVPVNANTFRCAVTIKISNQE